MTPEGNEDLAASRMNEIHNLFELHHAQYPEWMDAYDAADMRDASQRQALMASAPCDFLLGVMFGKDAAILDVQSALALLAGRMTPHDPSKGHSSSLHRILGERRAVIHGQASEVYLS